MMLKTTIKIAYLCTHDYCVDIGKANHVFYNLESMIQKWKVGPKFSEGDHIFRKNWSAGTKIFKENLGPRTIFTGTNIPVTGRHINHRSSKVDTSIFESRHIDLRRSTHRDIDLRRATHRSSKIDTSIIDLRKSTHRSIFEDRRRKHHTYNSSSNIVHNCAPKSLE